MGAKVNTSVRVEESPKYDSFSEIFASWESPSNIALIKYWGKTTDQIPMNPSLSMTLSKSVTRTTVKAVRKEINSSQIKLKFTFQNQPQPQFEAKLAIFLEKVCDQLPFLKHYALDVESSNTFPHSAGIASSASSMSALALCLVNLDNRLMNRKMNIHTFYRKASHIARIGSGSASRSLYGNYVLWGKFAPIPKSGSRYALPLPVKTTKLFDNLNDSILVIDRSEKSVSSRAGHELMNSHPFRKARIQQANENMRLLLKAMQTGNWAVFSKIVENEALTLHGLMMSSDPGFILMNPNTLVAIRKINDFRAQTGARITFTLDAGPNVHILYPADESENIRQFIVNELSGLCDDNFVIHDQIGKGPVKLI